MRKTSVTIFHQDGANYLEIMPFSDALVHEVKRVAKEDGGMRRADKIYVRIFSSDTPPFSVGDRLSVGLFDDMPHSARTIVEICVNDKGSKSTHHWKVLCE